VASLISKWRGVNAGILQITITVYMGLLYKGSYIKSDPNSPLTVKMVSHIVPPLSCS